MHKKLKMPTVLTVIIDIISSFVVNKNTKAEVSGDNINLVSDSLKYNNFLPKKFRKTSDLKALNDNKNLNLKGLDKLNISASQQFSEYNLPLLINAIGTSLPITVIDLRQESHGFINGLSVSWVGLKNNVNKGLTREQVLEDEANKLKNIKLNLPIAFYKHPERVIVPTKVQDENELVRSKSLFYNRITVKDGGMPSDDMVDYFIEFTKTQEQNSWLHFHCKAGVGRATAFMIMYDMIKNCKEVGFNDIINRQLALANFDDMKIKDFHRKKRMDFFNEFYDYCKRNGDSFKTKWSEWKKISVPSENIKL